MIRQVLRLRLERSGDARFISHLDLMRTFGRALLRAGVPVALTQGFNPHPRFSLAMALPLGASSEAEYVDVELREVRDALAVARELNRHLPAGIRVRQVQEIPPGSPSLQAQIRWARWRLCPRFRPPARPGELERTLQALLDEPSLPWTREKRGQVRTVDVRPLIRSARLLEPSTGMPDTSPGETELEAVLAVGDPSLRAADFVQLVARRGGWEVEALRMHLVQVYGERDGTLVDPGRLGDEAWRSYHRNRSAGFFER